MGTKSITLVLVAGLILVFGLTGCSGTVKREITQTVTSIDASGNPVITETVTDEKLPKDIAHEETLAKKHATCSPPVGRPAVQNVAGLSLIKPMELKSGAAQSDYMDALIFTKMADTNQILANALRGDPVTACHEAIAKEAESYYSMEAQRSRNRWSFGRFLAGSGFGYLAIDSIAGAGAAAGATYYQTSVGNRRAGGSGGSGATSSSGDSTISDVVINNGIGNASDRGTAAPFTDKVLTTPFDGDSNLDGTDEAGVRIPDNDTVNTDFGIVN